MSHTVTFTGAYVRYLDLRLDPKGENTHIRIHMTANYTKEVREFMKWPEDMPDVIETAGMFGEILGTNAIITPDDEKLKQHEQDIDIDSIEDFKAVLVGTDDKNKRELRFVIKSSKPDIETRIGLYVRRLGKAKGKVKVSYVKQETLEGTKTEPAQKNLVSIKKN